MCQDRERNHLIWNYQWLFMRLFKWNQNYNAESETVYLGFCVNQQSTPDQLMLKAQVEVWSSTEGPQTCQTEELFFTLWKNKCNSKFTKWSCLSFIFKSVFSKEEILTEVWIIN